MPRIDPLQLLNCLNVLLTPTGGIKSEQEVSRISSLMEKFSKKLVSKCVYLLILKASDVHLLSMFMASNGWNLIYNWLVQAIEAKNYPFLVELLEVIIMCPVDIERLKSNPMPRQIKYLSKDNSINPKVKELASDIVKHWLAIVKGVPATGQQNNSVPQPDSMTNIAHPATGMAQAAEVVEMQPPQVDDSDAADGPVSSNDSLEEEEDDQEHEQERDDTNYVKSTSPSSDSLNDSDDQDEFVPYKKQSPSSVKKKAAKASKIVAKKEKQSRKLNATGVEKPPTKLKSKLMNDVSSKDQKKGPIKLKIEKKRDDELPNRKPRKSSDSTISAAEKTIEEKIREKRRQREEKDREKFARLKREREKKEMKVSTSKEKRDKLDKLNKDKLDEKAKGDLSKLIPKPLDKLGRIPKLSSKESGESKANDSLSDETKRKDDIAKNDKTTATKSVDDKKTPKKDDATRLTIQRLKEEREREAARKEAKKAAIPVPPKKPVSMSVEKRFTAGESKPKTVKAYNSKFRLTGLEQETPKPPSRKPSTAPLSLPSPTTAPIAAVEVPTTLTPAPGSTSPVTNDKNAVKRSPTKDIDIEPVEKKMKSPEVSPEDKSPLLNKSKKPFLQESDDFMKAMTAAVETQKELLRKRKKPATKNDDGSSPTPKTPDGKDVKPTFKFYKDTLESSVDDSLNESVDEGLPDKSSSPDEKDTSIIEEVKPAVIKSAEGLKSALSLFRKRNQPKKSVKWRADDELAAVQFFEVDVSERANVVKDFWAMQVKERSAERESMLMVRKAGENDKMTEKIAWKKLVPIDLPPPSTAKGANSQEKNIQYARERTVPPALYYSKTMIPDTPYEPDLEIHSITQPPTIPLDDISGPVDTVNDFSTFKWPEPKQFPPDGSEFMPPNFMPGAVPPPMFAFPDGTFPPPFTQPFFPGGPVPPAGTWPTGTTDQSQSAGQTGQPMQWIRPPFEGVPPPNMVPPVGPGMMAPPPPFGMMAPVFPFPGAPNMFPPPGMTPPINNTNSTDTSGQFSPTNNYSNNSDSGSSKKWNSDDRYNRKDWKNNYSGDRSSRDKRGSGSWRGSGGNTRLCKYFQKKGYCNVNGCRFYHPEK